MQPVAAYARTPRSRGRADGSCWGPNLLCPWPAQSSRPRPLYINPRALKYFDTIRRCGSIREAARRLHLAVSAVNRQGLDKPLARKPAMRAGAGAAKRSAYSWTPLA